MKLHVGNMKMLNSVKHNFTWSVFTESLTYLIAPVLLLWYTITGNEAVLFVFLFMQFIFIIAYFCVSMGLTYIAAEHREYFKYLMTGIADYILKRAKAVVFYWAAEMIYLLISKLYFLAIITGSGAIMCSVFCGVIVKSAIHLNSGESRETI